MLELELRSVGPLRMARVRMRQLLFGREGAEDRRPSESMHGLLIVAAGELLVHSAGRHHVVAAGGSFLCHSTQPLEAAAGEVPVQCMALTLPAPLLLQRMPGVEEHLGSPLAAADPRARLLAQHLSGLFEAGPALSLSEGETLARQFCDLLVLLLQHAGASANAGAGADGEGGVRAAMRAAVLAFIERHYADESLDASGIARRCGISTSYLYKLLAPTGQTAIAHLRRVRLDAAFGLLSDGRWNDLSLGEIAFRCGFRSQSDLSRAFKRRFGRQSRAMRPYPPPDR